MQKEILKSDQSKISLFDPFVRVSRLPFLVNSAFTLLAEQLKNLDWSIISQLNLSLFTLCICSVFLNV